MCVKLQWGIYMLPHRSVELRNVLSSNIDSVGYDANTNTLLVRFKRGALYGYEGITPDIYNGLLTATSIGKYFASVIKGRYPYKEVKLNEEQ